jgi:methyltransferase (TIGR00027 family)
MDEELIQDVSDTALMVAAFRAMETQRRDALFRDPLAGKLAGAHGRRIVEHLPRGSLCAQWLVVLRTTIIDDFIASAVASGIDTVLNLGAGLDTRPYRMELPRELRWIEVDYEKIIALKESRLREDMPRCRLQRLALDLGQAGERRLLLRRIAAESERALVLTEGVVPYLPTRDVAQLADDLRAHHVFRYWIIDYFAPAALRSGMRSWRRMHMQNAPLRFEPDDYFAFFRRHGWTPKEIRYLGDEARKCNRPLQVSLKLRLAFTRLFMSRSRREALDRAAAYVLFEPAPPTGQ